MREIKEKTTVYISGKQGRRKATVLEAMPVKEAKKKKLYNGGRRSGTFLMLKLEDTGATLGRHKSNVYTDKK